MKALVTRLIKPVPVGIGFYPYAGINLPLNAYLQMINLIARKNNSSFRLSADCEVLISQVFFHIFRDIKTDFIELQRRHIFSVL